MSFDHYTPEYLAARRAALLAQPGPIGVDDSDPKGPSGHAYGLEVSSRLTSTYRQQRNIAMDVTPQQVIECMQNAGIKNWVLMGLHGYVGYLHMPRATQDVGVMVSYSERDQAINAIVQRWPELERTTFSQVVRFKDSQDLDKDGNAKPVIDLMLPWGKFQETILEKHVIVDAKTGSRYPTVEASIVAKYAPLVSPHRGWDKKQQDAVDLRNIIRNNTDAIDRDVLESLACEVWDGGGKEILEFLEIAIQDRPFPI